MDAAEIVAGVFEQLAEFTGCVEARDDRTIVVVKRHPFESARAV
jgi:serine phosphatase RsbU (regulator of sigma subunit)